MPLRIANLHYNPATQLYEITEDGITYGMPLEVTRGLKEFFVWYGPNDAKTVADWFQQLKLHENDQVIRTGNVPQAPDDFYPDVSYDVKCITK